MERTPGGRTDEITVLTGAFENFMPGRAASPPSRTDSHWRVRQGARWRRAAVVSYKTVARAFPSMGGALGPVRQRPATLSPDYEERTAHA
jgi:hypothetical protein